MSRLKAWDPTDKFVVGKQVATTTAWKAELSSEQLSKLNNLIPGFAENLLPQLALSHETHVIAAESFIHALDSIRNLFWLPSQR